MRGIALVLILLSSTPNAIADGSQGDPGPLFQWDNTPSELAVFLVENGDDAAVMIVERYGGSGYAFGCRVVGACHSTALIVERHEVSGGNCNGGSGYSRETALIEREWQSTAEAFMVVRHVLEELEHGALRHVLDDLEMTVERVKSDLHPIAFLPLQRADQVEDDPDGCAMAAGVDTAVPLLDQASRSLRQPVAELIWRNAPVACWAAHTTACGWDALLCAAMAPADSIDAAPGSVHVTLAACMPSTSPLACVDAACDPVWRPDPIRIYAPTPEQLLGPLP